MKTQKAKSINCTVLIAVLLFQIMYPTASFALADSPNQPEYESFEEFDTTDMVDLITGDFTYNIPLLNVSSPEGGFSVPLSYHAGIELNEESSWVGLGWGLNPGALTRNVSMYPDDYSGELVNTRIDNGGGSGYVKTYPFYTKYYDSQKGSSGVGGIKNAIDFGTGTNKHFGIAGMGLDYKNGKASFSKDYLIQGQIKGAEIALSVMGGPGGAIVQGFGAMAQGMADMQNKHSQIGGSGNVTVDKKTDKGYLFGIWGKKTDYKWYIKSDKLQRHYGTLYLGNMPYTHRLQFNNNRFRSHHVNWDYGSAPNNYTRYFHLNTTDNDPEEAPPTSDMHYYYESTNYAESANPTNLSYDNFNVKGFGVSGSINPYRMDMGTLSHPSMNLDWNISYVGTQYLENYDLGNEPEYKVQFKYHGDYSNSYTYHNMNTNGALTSNAFPYDIDLTQGAGTEHQFNVRFYNSKTYLKYDDQYAMGGVNSSPYPVGVSYADRTEQNRADTSLYNKKLVHARHIEWFSNHELVSKSASDLQKMGFMDSHQGYSDRSSRASSSPRQIGAFSITNDAGYTYHYSIPVYTRKNVFVNKNKESNNTYTTSKVEDDNSYAIAWLLTGITGPDFVDRTGNMIIDDNDWGYWVKFEYGKFSSNYTWRNPYYGTSGVHNISESMQKGEKETYYLNRISTRTHTALFVKNRKLDGKGYYESDGTDEFSNTIVTQPSESLRLETIYLLANTDYEKLVASTGSGGYGLTTVNSPATDATIATNGDTYNNILDVMDITAATNASQFLAQNQIQKIQFNYNYSLCGNTYNSFATQSNSVPSYGADVGHSSGTVLSGKLTLTSLEFFSGNNTRIMPSYIFKYGDASQPGYTGTSGHNPGYHPYKWDGNGMYKSGGSGQEETAHNCEKKADQWSLTDIVTPLNATVHVEYERDSYTSINGNPVSSSPITFFVTSLSGNSATLNSDHAGTTTNMSDYVSVGDQFTYGISNGTGSVNGVITAISGNVLTLSSSLPPGGSSDGWIRIKVAKKLGGGLRVKSITTSDENNSYKTKYIYTKNGDENGISSGVASFEPSAEKGNDFSFYKLFDHPYMSILYANVSVITGDVDNTFKEKSRESYHFVTPHQNMITLNSVSGPPGDKDYHSISSSVNVHYSGLFRNFATVNSTSAIGNLDTMKIYNQFNHLLSKTVFEYGDEVPNTANKKMGYYTENSLLWEFTTFDKPNATTIYNKTRFIQSYKLNKPNFLKSVTTYKDRMVSKKQIQLYNYETGTPLVTQNIYGGVEKYEEAVTPAYKIYKGMGSKVVNPANKNIMSAEAANYAYAYDKSNQKKLIEATVSTWGNLPWYRFFDNTSGFYTTSINPYFSSLIPYKGTWLPQKIYNWKSAVEENGTVKNSVFVPFSWTSGATQDPKWVQTYEATLYDPYSHPLEVRDINNKTHSIKYGYDHSYVVSDCENVSYKGWCYTGAEDKSPNADYYDGEVTGTNYQFKTSAYAHTGDYCSRMTAAGQAGFKFGILKADIPAGKSRASVWIHELGAQNAQLECLAYYGNGYVTSLAVSSFNSVQSMEKAGSFYQFWIEVDNAQIPNNTTHIVYRLIHCNPNSSMPVYADDFRVHPIGTPIVSNVFEPKSGKLVATLNEDNYATKYYYDKAGKLTSVYQETKAGFKLMSGMKYTFSR